ncbi:fatty acid hydroxylase vlmA-like [Lecanosticta acicola]|uniref:Fatty acid hydroxylase vlmA-like n=1 Tax=Lecanosticta acicola TaxID=111012 RepID=A0AAI9E913_9PEZI|nr:fatty acid hydroxylase vlmA-like [Lecanosticta acicola]
MGVQYNPQESMKSTWRTGDRKEWTRHHWTMEKFNLHPTDLDRPVPVHQKTDKVPYLPTLQCHVWVLAHAVWPMLLHQAYASLSGRNLPWYATFILYTLAFKINAVHELHMLRNLGMRYGFLDGDKHERDQVPDATVAKTFRALTNTSTFRPLMAVILAYRSADLPSSTSWWLPVELGLYGIVLDFWFYWYHRCMHEFDGLWKYHRTHHLTKHPTPLLTIYADVEQEIFDIAVIPLMTWLTLKAMGFPMGFYDWWICHQYIVFTELFGHSGVRLLTYPPSTNSLFLRLFDAELITEDHDLHHRKGYRKSHNYGKQTLLWDRVFGTVHERIESTPENIDYENPATLEFFPIIADWLLVTEKAKAT